LPIELTRIQGISSGDYESFAGFTRLYTEEKCGTAAILKAAKAGAFRITT